MRYRYAKLLAHEDLGAAGTKTIDLDLLDPISAIAVNFGTHNVDKGHVDHPAATLQRVELIDGSEVLYSLSGKQMIAQNFYNMCRLPWTYVAGYPGTWQIITPAMFFGRHLWDMEYGFDPKKHRNPKLRITHDQLASNTSVDENSCVVYAFTFDEVTPSFRGFIRQTEEYTYSITPGGTKYVDVPQEFVLREIYVQTVMQASTFSHNVAHVKLQENAGKIVPVDMYSHHLVEEKALMYGYMEELCRMQMDAAEHDYYHASTDYSWPAGVSSNRETDLMVDTSGGPKGTYSSPSTAGTITINTKGLVPFGVLPILNEDRSDPGVWYDPRNRGKVQLVLHSRDYATAGMDVNLVAEQIRPY